MEASKKFVFLWKESILLFESPTFAKKKPLNLRNKNTAK